MVVTAIKVHPGSNSPEVIVYETRKPLNSVV